MKDLFEFVKEAEKAGFDQTLTSESGRFKKNN